MNGQKMRISWRDIMV